MQTVMLLGDADTNEPDWIIRTGRNRGIRVFRVCVPKQTGIVTENRVVVHAIDLPLTDREWVMLAADCYGRIEHEAVAGVGDHEH